MTVLQNNIMEALKKYFEDALQLKMSLLDDYLECEPNLITVQNRIKAAQSELFGYIECLDDLNVFPYAELDEMFDKVKAEIQPRQKALEEKVNR